MMLKRTRPWKALDKKISGPSFVLQAPKINEELQSILAQHLKSNASKPVQTTAQNKDSESTYFQFMRPRVIRFKKNHPKFKISTPLIHITNPLKPSGDKNKLSETLPHTTKELTEKIGSVPRYYLSKARSINKTHRIANAILESHIVDSVTLKSTDPSQWKEIASLIKNVPLPTSEKILQFQKHNTNNRRAMNSELKDLEELSDNQELYNRYHDTLNYELKGYNEFENIQNGLIKSFDFKEAIQTLDTAYRDYQRKIISKDSYITIIVKILDDFHLSNRISFKDLATGKISKLPKELQLQMNILFPLIFDQAIKLNIQCIKSEMFKSFTTILPNVNNMMDDDLLKYEIEEQIIKLKFLSDPLIPKKKKEGIINRNQGYDVWDINKVDEKDIKQLEATRWTKLENYIVHLTPELFDNLLTYVIEKRHNYTFFQFLQIMNYKPPAKESDVDMNLLTLKGIIFSSQDKSLTDRIVNKVKLGLKCMDIRKPEKFHHDLLHKQTSDTIEHPNEIEQEYQTIHEDQHLHNYNHQQQEFDPQSVTRLLSTLRSH